MKTVVTFGEIMGRLAAPGNLRLRQTRQLDVVYAGSEANVAASICNFGGLARFVTALPQHALADATLDSVRAVGIDTQHIVRTDDGRLGLYFLETGANQRPSNVIYDRADSSIAVTPGEAYDWDAVFQDAGWLHLSGITPALSKLAAEATLIAAQRAKAAGATVSIDLNFRRKLWKWDSAKSERALAKQTISAILPHVDVIIANEQDCDDVLGIAAEATDVQSGALDVARYPAVARKIMEAFDNISKIAITLRESHSATHNNWGAMLYDSAEDKTAFSPRDQSGEYSAFQIKHIIDRVGAGDSFAAGLVFAMCTPELSNSQLALDFAVAASCLKHSIHGDFNFSTREEVEALMNGAASGRVNR